MLDSAAFTEVSTHGGYRSSPREYAVEAERWRLMVPGLLVIVAQDYMCEPFILAKTGLTIAEHQRLTIERYDALLEAWEELNGAAIPVMPVLQGFEPEDYVAHLRAYGDRIKHGMWVGVGSVCKRQGDPTLIYRVLAAIKAERPDLRLHGFGIKLTALADPRVRKLLYSADSMAWSFSARKQGRNQNDPQEAVRFSQKVERLICQN
jgi:hypothetical protein